MRNHTPAALEAARRLRRDMSLPERLLWARLRRNPVGIKFRRQHPLGRYVVDFYCDAARTIFEIDGIAHDMADRPERDFRRDEFLTSAGFRIIRIAASDVLRDVGSIAEAMISACRNSPPPSALRGATSPDGEGVTGAFPSS